MRKRGWHGEEVLGSVAWLCRACHSFLHGLVGNEELARGFYTVGLILEGGVDGEFLGFLMGLVGGMCVLTRYRGSGEEGGGGELD